MSPPDVMPNATLAKYAIAWLKRYVDDDTRYEQFLCPAPSGSTISQYRDTCRAPDSIEQQARRWPPCRAAAIDAISHPRTKPW
jgi:hypothetical protein